MITTKIVETNVLGARAYHYECECGVVGKRYDRETTAVRHAKKHASEDCVRAPLNIGTPMSLGDFLDAATPAP